MLTKADLTAIEKIFDKKTKEMVTDIAAIQTRLTDLERTQVTKLDLIEVRRLVAMIERRGTALEGRVVKLDEKVGKLDDKVIKLDDRVTKTLTKEDLETQLKKRLRGMIKKEDILALERRLIKKLNFVIDTFDGEIMTTRQRVERLEDHLNLPQISSAL